MSFNFAGVRAASFHKVQILRPQNFLDFHSVVFLMGLGFGLRFKLISLLVHIPLVIFN